MSIPGYKWWQTAVFYQIYPRSFADGNGDGIGDLQGMIDRLDYLHDLGVDAIWLSPHYPSPQFDCGYDVADYTGVDPEYGDLDLFRQFLDGLHQRGMRLILDLVLNHTSDQHPWFIASQSGRDNPYRDWYVWRDGRNGGPPNNWLSAFGGSAWRYDPATDQYYYHYFFDQQPDLNWHNPAVKQAMFDAVRFWLDMGVDGFRIDAIGTLFEDPDLPDQTAELSLTELLRAHRTSYPDQPDAEQSAYLREQRIRMFIHQRDRPEIHEVLQELRSVVDEYDDRVLVGETDEISYHGQGDDELHLVFNFPLMRTTRLKPAWIRSNQDVRLNDLPPGAWPCNTLGNHDSSRVYTHFGDGEHDDSLARLSLALMLTLWGTPFLYNGEEIGMRDLLLDRPEQFRDNLSPWLYEMEIELFGTAPDEAVRRAAEFGRDKCRTPMQWDNSSNAGFSPPDVKTWLPVHPNYAEGVTVTAQKDNPGSLFRFYRRMLRVRRENRALITGDYIPVHRDAESYLAFLRRAEDQTCLVVLNYGDRAQSIRFDLDWPRAEVIFSEPARNGNFDRLSELTVDPFGIYIGQLNSGG